MTVVGRVVVGVVATLLALGAGEGQAMAAPQPSPSQLTVDLHAIDIKRFPLVELNFTMTDPVGRAVASLDVRDFAVHENLRTAKIENLVLDTTPLSVVLLLDRSGSMYEALEFLRMAAAKFVSLLEPQDQVMLIDFSDEPKILCRFTNDREKLAGCLRTLKAWGPTALYDSLFRSVLELQEAPGRRVVVALTDGTDQNEARTARLSRHTLQEVAERARASDIPIYTIGMGRYVERRELSWLAKGTGAAAFFAPTPEQLQELYAIVARNLKARVRLTYRSPEPRHDGAWREVVLRCSVGGAPSGQAAERYRAPGRYVLEVEGQGWEATRVEALEKAEPALVLRDVRLQALRRGGPGDVGSWLGEYFRRPASAPVPPAP